MQNSKRVQRILKLVDEIEEVLEYYTNGSGIYHKDFKEIRETIDELGLEKKQDRARLAKKLKWLWEHQDEDSGS